MRLKYPQHLIIFRGALPATLILIADSMATAENIWLLFVAGLKAALQKASC